MQDVRLTGCEGLGPQPAACPIDRDGATHRAGADSIFVALATLALPAILLSGCASTACEEWGRKVESVRVCNAKGTQCSYRDQPVQYCARTTGESAASAPAPEVREPGAPRPQPEERRETPAPEKIAEPAPAPVASPPEPRRVTPVAEKIVKRAPAQAKEDRRTQAGDKTGTPNLNRFWRSLYSASRYPGLRYGKVARVAIDPATAPASSARVVAALKKNVRTVVSMEVASDRKYTPMDHRLGAVVYQARDPEAALALYTAIVRDEWRARKRQAPPGVRFVVVNTGDKRATGQRIFAQRGSYVVDIHEWKSIYRDSKGKPIPGERFAHSRPINPDTVARAVIRTFPAK